MILLVLIITTGFLLACKTQFVVCNAATVLFIVY